MAARVIHCFGSGVCEALPVQLVNDIFFLHERGKRLGYYTGMSIDSLLRQSQMLMICSCSLLRRYWTSVCRIHAQRRTFLASILLC
jgi:hypothetical protein